MGIFDGFAGGIVGGIASAFGAASANSTNKKLAEKQMEYQTSMSNTAYQRSMSDMRSAGLNPILAYKQGGASTPSGAMATAGNVGAAATEGFSKGSSSAIANMKAKKEIEILDETIDNIKNDTYLKQQQSDQSVNLSSLYRQQRIEKEAFNTYVLPTQLTSARAGFNLDYTNFMNSQYQASAINSAYQNSPILRSIKGYSDAFLGKNTVNNSINALKYMNPVKGK